jgi:poly-gamma-glutamate synthesis protein (capsule biosynthesis protein)
MIARTLRSLLIPALLAGCADAPVDDEVAAPGATAPDETGTEYVPGGADGKADGFSTPLAPLKFAGACEPGDRLTIAAVGDVLLHGRLQQQAFRESDGYVSLWRGVKPLLEQADVTYANLEGPTAAGVDARGKSVSDPGRTFDNRVYTSYPMFNYHPTLLDDLMASGVDVVSTANNHSLDRRALGADRTIDALEARGLPFTGTRRAGETREWHTITEKNGFRLAWLACTYGTNGIPDPQDQVLLCFRDADEIEAIVRDLSTRVDAVIVTPHWGDEYHARPNSQQVALGKRLLEAGALAVIGSHPHVLQPWQKHITADGRETFIIYSLGNFVSGQRHLPRRSTLLLYLGLTRTPEGRTVVNGARYVPLHMSETRDGRLELEATVPADSRALTVGTFGEWNVQSPTSGLVTNPECDPSWTPPEAPHAHDGWIGGACEGADVCGGAECLDNLPGGLCTEWCERTCPDRLGRAVTFCADLGFDNGGVCVARCVSDAECRDGYACREVARPAQPDYIRKACVPVR